MDTVSAINVRLDKWLWAVRVFKTRSQATEACKSNKILINGEPVKSSHAVKIGETIEFKTPLITRSFLVKGTLEKRVSAKVVFDYMIETTPPEAFEKMAAIKNNMVAVRDRGTGRPTKRDRRLIEKLKEWDEDD